jgi:hypothetical protein
LQFFLVKRKYWRLQTEEEVKVIGLTELTGRLVKKTVRKRGAKIIEKARRPQFIFAL